VTFSDLGAKKRKIKNKLRLKIHENVSNTVKGEVSHMNGINT